MSTKIPVFIDGSAGTTGLRIRERLAARPGIELLTLPEERRKDPAARAAAMDEAAAVFLCLPDAAAVEAAALVRNPRTVLIDASTAHRVAPGWTYGLPELPGRRDEVRAARRIANPGCHATGFIVLAAPLVRAGLLAPDAFLTCFSLTGYTGGGKKMIAAYEEPRTSRAAALDAPRQYGLSQAHKHLPEMAAQSGLSRPPAFCPVVADFPRGMEVTVPLDGRALRGTLSDVEAVLREAWPAGSVVHFDGSADDGDGFLSANAFAGRDDLQVLLLGGAERPLLVARFDNLGKGASGAAIQNMNLALGLPETEGLVLGPSPAATAGA